jgi:hypothetical protein
MDQHVVTIEFTDGVWRKVYEDSHGRQHVIDGDGAPVYGVWFIPREDVKPNIVVDARPGKT